MVRTMQVSQFNPDGSIEYTKIGENLIEADEYPTVYYAYSFPPPGLLVGRGRQDELTFEAWCLIDRERMKKFAPGDKQGMRIGPSSTRPFCQMLAKIAHSYAVAELGYDSFEHSLTPFIRGFQFDGEPQWIGGCPAGETAPNTRLHEIGWEVVAIGGTFYATVVVRLFCFLGTPSYQIVVGKLTRALDSLPFLKQPPYKIDIKEPVLLPEMTLVTQVLRGSVS
ncbi:hypothetical protein [Hyphomicrobium sp. MC1]|uniref:hypothetical protein n=1 Tax=Hyphomicrobium sp. (strain MC1) TaxID=717785 RepID=UPI000213D3FA|nr:hypothetical protein [Hyphomicrobium sp. MC1]CCB67452.1 protein of unknown function [Hyphomicrobium sp. MC1]